jgi:hypothetical protein
MFENRVLRRIFGPAVKRQEVTGGWRKLHNEEQLFVLTKFYSSSYQIKKDEMSGVYNLKVRNYFGELGVRQSKMKMNLKEAGRDIVDLIHLAQW